MRRYSAVVDRPNHVEIPMTEPTPTTEDGEVIGTPPAPPTETEPLDPAEPEVPIMEPPLPSPPPVGDEVDPADL